MILRNHGLLTVGRTIPETFLYLYRLKSACQVQLDAMASGQHAGLKHFTSVVNAYIRADDLFLFCYASSMQS